MATAGNTDAWKIGQQAFTCVFHDVPGSVTEGFTLEEFRVYANGGTIVRPMLGQNAAEAQKLTFGGRDIRLLKEQKTFDSSRLETTALFAPARKQGSIF